MDFNSKSKSWAGNLYHQFESICQDVDGFIKKETLKLVGNQVQNVGKSVKILCSNVVQDVITLSEDIGEPERQSTSGEQDGMLDPIPITDIKATTPCTDEKQFPKDQVSDDHKMQISKPENTLDSQTCQYLEGDGNTIVHTFEENCSAENKVTECVISVTANSNFDREISYGKSDEDYLSSSPVFSALEEDSTSIEKERREFNPQKVDTDFSDAMVYLSEISSTGWLSKSASSVSEDPFSDESESLSSPPMPVSPHEIAKVNFLLMDSPLPPTCDVDDSASEEGRVSCESCYTKGVMSPTFCTPKFPITLESISADFSKNAENILHSRSASDGGTHNMSAAFSINVADTTKESTSADIITKAENILYTCSVSDGFTHNISAAFCINNADTTTKEASSADFITKAGNILPSHSVADGCACNISAVSSINAADTTTAFDNSALQTNMSDSLIGSSESGNEEYYREGYSKIATSPSETENTNVLSGPTGDLDLESVDLSPDPKHNTRSVVLNSSFVLAGSYRRKDFQYYKNLIKDALTSQKRLSKEYEHLALMYEDIDGKPNQLLEPSSLSSFPNTAPPVAGTQSSQEMKDQWELL